VGGAVSIKKETPHYIGHKKRLKERFLNAGPDALAEYELLELLLSLAISRQDVKPLAKALLEKFGSFAGVLDAETKQLLKVEGMGQSSAAAIKLVKESSIIYLKQKSIKRSVISSPEALINYCKAAMTGLRDEEFRVIFLNSKNEIIDDEVLCRGTVDQTAVYPRKILERSLHHNAASVIFVHNHPSGHPAPSNADKDLTKLLKEAVGTVQIKVHDHMIIGREDHFSFAEAGLL
jgi:DNA repair protein RadC